MRTELKNLLLLIVVFLVIIFQLMLLFFILGTVGLILWKIFLPIWIWMRLV